MDRFRFSKDVTIAETNPKATRLTRSDEKKAERLLPEDDKDDAMVSKKLSTKIVTLNRTALLLAS